MSSTGLIAGAIVAVLLATGALAVPGNAAAAVRHSTERATAAAPGAPHGLPTAAEQDDDDVPAYNLGVAPDGSALVVSGGVRFGLDRDIEAALDANPGIRTIELTGPGGRLAVAEKVAKLIKQRGLDTLVEAECASACTRIFVAGRHRTIRPGARLGFHGAAFTEPVPGESLLRFAANQFSIEEYVGDGVDRSFMQRAVGVAPSDIWYPTTAQLLAAHVITGVAKPAFAADTGPVADNAAAQSPAVPPPPAPISP